MKQFTDEEKDLLRNVLLNTPLQGNIKTLPKAMETIFSILKKLEEPEMEGLKSMEPDDTIIDEEE